MKIFVVLLCVSSHTAKLGVLHFDSLVTTTSLGFSASALKTATKIQLRDEQPRNR